MGTISFPSCIPSLWHAPPAELWVGITDAVDMKRCEGEGMNDVGQRKGQLDRKLIDYVVNLMFVHGARSLYIMNLELGYWIGMKS